MALPCLLSHYYLRMRQLKIQKSITNRNSDSLERYLTEIGREKLITPDEEVQLAQLIHRGGREGTRALDKLVRANLRFVVSVAKQYQNQGMELPDLINEGNIGLIKAAEKFDETKGFKFISYAVWWIRQSILSALAEQSRMVRIPQNQVGNLSKIIKARNAFEADNQRKPSVSELAAATGMDEDKVREVLELDSRDVSVDAPFEQGETSSLLDVLPDDDSPVADHSLMHESLATEIESALTMIPEREADVLKMFFGLAGQTEMTFEEIGMRLNVSRERARQIKEKGLRHLREASEETHLKTYLG